MNQFKLYIALTLACSQSIYAQYDNVKVQSPVPVTSTTVNPTINTTTANNYTNTSLNVIDMRDSVAYTVITASPQQIVERLNSIQSLMPLRYNEDVQKYIDYFVYKRPSFTKEMLEKKDYYFPIFEKYLAKYNMPQELKYLALLESGLNPEAVSRSKAIGMWQFMSPTGRELGLTINSYVDERMHVEKSTDAACRYLKKLYTVFGDWDLALASYNTGPGNIRRAIRKSGRTNYWDIHPYIHRDTRAYVPQFIALNYLMNYSAEHGIYATEYKYPEEIRDIRVNGFFDLDKFADLTGISQDKIRELNPHIKTKNVPSNVGNLDIRVPLEKVAYITENKDYLYSEASHSSGTYASTATPRNEITIGVNPTVGETYTLDENGNKVYISKPQPQKVVAQQPIEKPIKVAGSKKYHKIRKGENLDLIAKKYNVSVSNLKDWNNLRSSRINYGKNLVVYSNKAVNTGAPTYHKVQKGDTLWSISKKYAGISVEDLKRLNNISGNSLAIGQKIKIKG